MKCINGIQNIKWRIKIYFIAFTVLGNIFMTGCDEDNVSITGFERGKLTWERIYVSDSTIYFSMTVSDDGVLYVGTRSNILRYDEIGDTMLAIREDFNSSTVYSLETSKNGTIYAGTNGLGMLRSSNSGQDWVEINTGLDSAVVYDIDINGAGEIFIATNKGAFISSNDGDVWTSLPIDSTVSFVFTIAVSPNGSIFAGTAVDSGIYRSSNNGLSWVKVIDFLTSEIAVNSYGDIFAGAFTQFEWGFIRSTDGGISWSEIGPLAFNTVNSVVFDSQDDVYLVNHAGIFRSFDNGDTWIVSNDGLTSSFIHIRTMAVSKNDVFYCGVDFDGIFRGTFN